MPLFLAVEVYSKGLHCLDLHTGNVCLSVCLHSSLLLSLSLRSLSDIGYVCYSLFLFCPYDRKRGTDIRLIASNFCLCIFLHLLVCPFVPLSLSLPLF